MPTRLLFTYKLVIYLVAPTESVSVYFFNSTPIEKEKKLISAFRDIRNYISNKLEKLTLEDLI